MKQLLLISALLTMLLFTKVASAQNIFPSSGNTGIGTITPTDKLTVLTPLATNGITHTDGSIKLTTYLNAGAGYIGTASNHPLCLRTNGSSAQVILLQNGNLGIGTTSPSERLTVRSASGIAGFAHTDGIVKIGSTLNTTGALFGTISNHPLFLRTNNGPAQVTLLQNGRVGIGTTTPAGLLDVTGSDMYVQGVRIGTGAGNHFTNTALGRDALMNVLPADDGISIVTGYYNTAVGSGAMKNQVYGLYNVGVGYQSFNNSIDGEGNVGVGVFTLSNCNSKYNTAMGMYAMSGGITGNNNTGVGQSAMGGGTGGNNNTGIGAGSLYRHNKGDGNAALGVNSLTNDTSGIYNTAIGFETMLSNKSGFQNTAVGTRSLEKLATGFDNVAVGYYSTDSLTSGFRNTALGSYSLFRNKTSYQNTALGYYSLYNATSANNVGVGALSMLGTTTGSGNTGVGYNANVNAGTLVNTTAIGYLATTTASNQVRVGNSSVTSIGGFVNWSNVSDGRIKINVQENVPGLDFINQLKPVTYNLDLDAAEKLTGTNWKGIDKQALQEHKKEKAAKEQLTYTGFIAQDVEKAAQASKFDFSGVDAPKNSKDLYGLRYAEFVAPLVKAVQELSKQNEILNSKIEKLEAANAAKLEQHVTQTVAVSRASLLQNVPNPFKGSTSIGYTLPEKTSSAQIVITDQQGRKIKTIPVGGSSGNITLNTNELNAGFYQYTLYINGSIAESRQMIVSK